MLGADTFPTLNVTRAASVKSQASASEKIGLSASAAAAV
jgi:hypothetical protein